jgi:hypothetical protein
VVSLHIFVGDEARFVVQGVGVVRYDVAARAVMFHHKKASRIRASFRPIHRGELRSRIVKRPLSVRVNTVSKALGASK